MRYSFICSTPWLTLLTTCLLAVSSPVAAAPAPAPGSGDNPALAKFGADITFYQSFDSGPVADLSGGDPQPGDPKLKIDLEPGLFKQAFLSGQEGISYLTSGNLDLSKPGSLSVWISPYQWKRDGSPYIFFINILDRGRQLMLARMGDPRNHEALYAYMQVDKQHLNVRAGDTLKWQDGQWHLLVVNWSSESYEFSVDGATPQSTGAQWLSKSSGAPGRFFVGGKGDLSERYLLDELLVLDRPLSNEDIAWLYNNRPTPDESGTKPGTR